LPNNELTIGNVKITSLSDGHLEFDVCNFFPDVPKESWVGLESHLSPVGNLNMNLACYLIRSEGHTIAVDTGMGPKATPDLAWGELLNEFDSHGIRPEEVDMVVLTHAHLDHIGWNLVSRDGKYTPTFPNATYYMSTKEWEDCHNPELVEKRFAKAPESLWPLEELGIIQLVDGEHPLTGEVRTLPTPGHTLGHISLAISSEGAGGLVLGDALHNTAQIENTDWVSFADMDPEQTRATRRNLMEWCEREGISVAAVHMAAPGFGKIVRMDGRRNWQAF